MNEPVGAAGPNSNRPSMSSLRSKGTTNAPNNAFKKAASGSNSFGANNNNVGMPSDVIG